MILLLFLWKACYFIISWWFGCYYTMYQDPLLCFVLREIGRWVVSEFVEKDSKLLKKKKKNAKVKSWDYCYLVHHGHNCLCLCIYLQEVILNTPLVKLLNDHQEAFAGVYCWDLQEMDPGRYGLQQGWDNNSVIVVSSLIITYVGW